MSGHHNDNAKGAYTDMIRQKGGLIKADLPLTYIA